MAKQVVKSDLFKKLGAELARAHDNVKNDDTEFSNFGDLPAGINNGIAQLVEVKFDTYKKGTNEGQYFFYAAGVVLEPKEHNKVRVEGLRTSITEPLCPTPQSKGRKTVEDHLKHIYNELRKLGLNTAELGVEDLEAACQALKESRPFFRFRTWQGQPTKEYPDPRVNHQWNGACQYDLDSSGTPGVDDDTAPPEESRNGALGSPDDFPDEATASEDEAPAQEEAPPDLDALAKVADDPEADSEEAEESQAQLTRAAEEAGIDQERVAKAKNWRELVKLIRSKTAPVANSKPKAPPTKSKPAPAPVAEEEEEGEEEEAAEEAQEGPATPQVEEIWLYRPLDPTTKKPGKPVEVEVLEADEDAKVVKIKKLDDHKVIKNVKFDRLEPVG